MIVNGKEVRDKLLGKYKEEIENDNYKLKRYIDLKYGSTLK